MLCRKACPSAFLHFVGEFAHGLLRNVAAFTPSQRSLGPIDGGDDFCAGTLAFFPHDKSLLYRVFFPVEAAALDSVADKCLLVWCELNFHRFQGTEKRADWQRQ
jgi:hypothetical protein